MKFDFATIGVGLIIIGFIFIMLSSLQSQSTTKDGSNTKIFAGGFIGPIPFGFGSDKEMMYVGIALMVLMVAFYYVLGQVR